MKNRKLIITICVAICFLLMPCLNVFSGLTKVFAYNYDSISANARQVFDFNGGWKFSKGEGIENSGSSKEDAVSSVTIPNNSLPAVYNTSYVMGTHSEVWTDVSLPHTYNDTDTFDDYVEELNNDNTQSLNGERSMYGGTAWYKKSFWMPYDYEASGKRVIIEFEAVRQVCQVWVNGELVSGTSFNGFIPFGYDLTDYLIYGNSQNHGATNEITVLVDNSYPYFVTVDGNGDLVTMFNDGSTAIPLDGSTEIVWNNGMTAYSTSDNPLVWHDSHWHPNYGGIYRNCNLYVTSGLQLTLPLYSFIQTQGTYIWTSDETCTNVEDVVTSTANINIQAEIKNYLDTTQNFTAFARIKDMSGQTVGEVDLSFDGSTSLSLDTGESMLATATCALSNVIRWSTDYPYLYTVECLIIQSGVCVDNNRTDIGVRTFRATNDSGFLLNENYIYLSGWGQKPTNEWAGIGSAYPDWMHEYVIQLMKEANGNYIRWGHCAGGATSIKLCDRLGVIVTQPGVDGEGSYNSVSITPGTELDYTEVSLQIRYEAFRDMIIYFRNNPSILIWELGNNAIRSNVAYTASLRALVNQYDFGGRALNGDVGNAGTYENTTDESTRLSTIRKAGSGESQYVDVYETTDIGDTSSLPDVEGEYNRVEARRGVWDRNTVGFTDFSNEISNGYASYRYLTSEAVAKTQEERFVEMQLLGLNHMGGANWIFSDSISHARLLSEVCRASGEVDATMLEKESYYVMKVLQSKQTLSHIIGHWNYSNILSGGITKYVVSKAFNVKLFVSYEEDGEQHVDEYTASSKDYYLFTFNNVVWKSGKVYVIGYDSSGNIIPNSYNEVLTHDVPTHLKINRVVGVGNDLKANAGDYLILDIELLDENNVRCYTYDGEFNNTYVNFVLSGEGTTCEWIGGYNSSIENTIRSKNLYLEAGITRVAIRTTKTSGEISLAASMGVFGDVFTINSVSVRNIYDQYCADYNYLALTDRLSMVDLTNATYTVPNTISAVAPLENAGEAGIVGVSNYVDTMEIFGGANTFTSRSLTSNEDIRIYNDRSYYWKVIPSRYSGGGEFIQIANALYTNPSPIVMNIIIKQAGTMLLMLPVKCSSVPQWMTNLEFVSTGQIFISSNNDMYMCYEKSVIRNMSINLSTIYNTADTNDMMYLFGFATPVILSHESTLLEETFEDGWTLAEANTSHGAISHTATNATITREEFTDSSPIPVTKSAIHMVDSLGGDTCYLTYPINSQLHSNGDIFEVNFDFWITKSATCKFVRVILNKNSDYSNAGENSAVRLFLNNDNNMNYVNAYYRMGKDTENTALSNFTTSTYASGVWNSYKLVVNMVNYTIETKISVGGSWVSLNGGNPVSFANTVNKDSINYVMFAGGNNGAQNFAIANVSVESLTTSGVFVNSVSIQGQPFVYFNSAEHYFFVRNIPESLPMIIDTDIVLDITGCVVTDYDIEIDDYRRRAIVTCLYNGGQWVYVFSFAYHSEYDLSYGLSFYDKLVFNPDESRSREIETLYSRKSVYYDLPNVYITSVPYHYAGAEFVIQNTYDEETSYKLKFRYNTTVLMMIRVFESHNATMTDGFTATSEILSLSNGLVYKIFEQQFLANQIWYLDNADFKSLTYAPIVAYKASDDIENNVFVYDSFAVVDDEGVPYTWNAVYDKQALTTSIQYVAATDSLDFIDRSTINEGTDLLGNELVKTSEANTKFAYINKNFSEQHNIFTFETEIFVVEDPLYKIDYIRFWFTDGDMEDANYSSETEKERIVATELYLFTGVANDGTMDLVQREWTQVGNNTISGTSRNNQRAVISGIEKGVWFKLFFTIDVQNHSYNIRCTYTKGDTNFDQTSNTFSFLKNRTKYLADNSLINNCFCVDRINNLVVGTSKNFHNYFKIRYVDINQVDEQVVADLSYSYDDVAYEFDRFNSLTSDYLIELDENNVLPDTINVSKGSNASSDDVSITFTEDSIYEIDVISTNGSTYNYKVHVYGNITKLRNLRNLYASYNANTYTASSWAQFSNAYSNATDLVNNYSHNVVDIENAYNELLLAEGALTYAIVIGGEIIGLGRQLNENEFVEDPNGHSIDYDGVVTISVTRTVGDSSVFTEGHRVNFSTTLPIGTRLILADFSKSSSKYYYFVIVSEVSTILFNTAFTSMGFVNDVFAENVGAYSGEMRLVLDFSQAVKKVGDISISFAINNQESQSCVVTLLDRSESITASIVSTVIGEKDYIINISNSGVNNYNAFSADEGAYVTNANNVYNEENGVILMPSNVITGVLHIPSVKNETTNYTAPQNYKNAMALTLDAGIGEFALNMTIDDSDKVVIKNDIQDILQLDVGNNIMGEILTNVTLTAYTIDDANNVVLYDSTNITFDNVNSKILISNIVDVGLYRLRFSFIKNDYYIYDDIYILVK